MFESPSSHPTITKEEKEYIELSTVNTAEVISHQMFFFLSRLFAFQIITSSSTSLIPQVTQGSVPWKSILTSPPVWGIIAGGFASDWGLYVLLICVPLFLLEVLHYEVAEVGGF